MSYPWVNESETGDRRRPGWPDEETGDLQVEPARAGERRLEVVRRIDPWSALKVSLVLYLCIIALALAAGVGLWVLGRRVGFIDGIESSIEDLYFPGTFSFKDTEILILALIGGPILAVVAALITTAGVGLYNLVARLTGGVEVTVNDPKS